VLSIPSKNYDEDHERNHEIKWWSIFGNAVGSRARSKKVFQIHGSPEILV
jgi:hypothetical protein